MGVAACAALADSVAAAAAVFGAGTPLFVHGCAVCSGCTALRALPSVQLLEWMYRTLWLCRSARPTLCACT